MVPQLLSHSQQTRRSSCVGPCRTITTTSTAGPNKVFHFNVRDQRHRCPPGKSGLTFDHILTDLLGELQKVVKLVLNSGEIHDTL